MNTHGSNANLIEKTNEIMKKPEDITNSYFSLHRKIKCRICGEVLESIRTDNNGIEALMELTYHIHAKHSGNENKD